MTSDGIVTLELSPEEVTHDSFRPFGDVMRPPVDAKPLTNSDFLAQGKMKGISGNSQDNPGFEALDYWPDLATLPTDPLKVGLLRPRVREPRVTLLERHIKGSQGFIPLGSSDFLFIVGEDTGCGDSDASPNLGTMRSFILRGGTGVNIHPGTWHWTPFPLSPRARDMLILVRKAAAIDDLHLYDISERLGYQVTSKYPTGYEATASC